MTSVDICHICERPPSFIGSVNKLVAQQITLLKDFSQVYVCGESVTPQDHKDYSALFGWNMAKSSLFQRALLSAPDGVRARALGGIRSRRTLACLIAAKHVLQTMSPKLVVVHDCWKILAHLQPHIQGRSKVIYFQHGYSYFSAAASHILYSGSFVNTVVHLTVGSYLHERNRMQSYISNVEVVPNPVDTQIYRPPGPAERKAIRAELGILEESFVVCFVGRLVPKKGLHIIIGGLQKVVAAKRFIKLLVVGGGDEAYVSAMKESVDKMGLGENVVFAGRVEKSAIPKYLKASDLFVFPTLCAEGMSLAVCEAMACGLPVVCSDGLGTSELVNDGVAKIVHGANISNKFVEAVCSLIRDDDELHRLRAAARDHVVRNYTIDLWISRVRQLYERELQHL